MPGFLLVFVLILWGILSIRIGIQVGEAMELTGRKISLAGPILDAIGIDRLHEAASSRLEMLLPEPFGEIVADIGADQVASIVSEAWVLRVFDAEFSKLAPAGTMDSRLLLGEGMSRWGAHCESRLSEDLLHVTLEYRIRTPIGPVAFQRKMTFPVWISGDGTLEAKTEDNVWSYGNLERGRRIRTRFGGNLPLGFPVIASFRDGTATSIHSMDLSEYGWQDASEAEKSLMSFLVDLETFQGTHGPWGKDGIDIDASEIHTRRLLLVVPLNLDSLRYSAMLDRAGIEAEARGLVITVIRFQERRATVAVE